MYIFEKRLDNIYAIKVEDEIGILTEKLEWWLTPFFVIGNTMKGGVLLATIIVTKTIDTPFSYSKPSIFFIDGKMCEDSVYYNIMYVVRSVFKNLATRFGYFNVHAGCISCDDIGILIKAERNQGKTTLILHSLISKKYQIVANDQVMLNETSSEALGYPATVGIRNNSCTDILQKKINEKALWMIKDPYQVNEKPIVHINDLRSVFGCCVKEKIKIGLILEYEKSDLKDELEIITVSNYKCNFTEMAYPLSEIYGRDIFAASSDCLLLAKLNYLSQSVNEFGTEIQLLKVKCGMNRINDLLQELQVIVNERKEKWMRKIK